MRQRALLPLIGLLALALPACGGDDDDTADATSSTSPTSPTSPTTPTTPTGPMTSTGPTASAASDLAVVAGQPLPPARCEANRAAGTITYLSGFDFAATASIVEVVIAEQAGYFDELCLDVELQPSFSTANYPLIASGEAQFASGGSFSEVLNYAAANDADLVAAAVEGRSAIDGLILHPGTAATLEDLAGTTIGVKGALPTSVKAMLASAGLGEGVDYETVLLDGFDPLAHWALDGIVGFPGYKSNEPGQLERAGIAFDLFDPTAYDIPGSFGVLYTTQEFIDEHPTAAQDFLRASMRGLADAVADPAGAAATAIALVEAGGNPSFLSAEGETFRWSTDAAILEAQGGAPMGVPELDGLQAEVDAYADVGLFGDAGAPDLTAAVDVELISAVYDDAGEVVWPGN